MQQSRNMTERIYDEKRLTTPLKRTGAKGQAIFEPISWDEAIDTITSRWKQLIDEEELKAYSRTAFMEIWEN